MPETEYECISQERLQSELRACSSSTSTSSSSSSLDAKDLIILDCRSSHEYSESHIRSAVNFSIPSIMLRRLAAGKIDLLSTIKSSELKARIEIGYELSLFILYNDVGVPSCDHTTTTSATAPSAGGGFGGVLGGGGGGGGIGDSTINILHRRLKQDGCRVVLLQDGFSSFRQAFPEWCEDDSTQYKEMESSRSTQADQLMGLRSLRISTPHSDSACSSSGESSDCESTTIHHNFNEEPVEIIPGLFLGNASHSCDSRALQKYNIKYVLNVTPDLPNVFEATGGIQYLQIPITDHYSQDLAMHFPAAIQFIEEARAKQSAVLVHCLAGVSRSVTVTLAYLMHTRALCLNEAFMLVRERKPDVSPNFHFMQQLHSFERQLQISPNDAMDVGGEALHHLNGMVGGGGPGGLVGCGGGLSVGGGTSMLLGGSGGSTPSALPQRSGGMSGGGGLTLPGSGCSLTSTTSSTSSSSSSSTTSSNRCGISKFSCNCPVADCKCMQNAAGYMAAHMAKAGTGVSPDSGIEFDRWTPAADSGGGSAAAASSSLLK